MIWLMRAMIAVDMRSEQRSDEWEFNLMLVTVLGWTWLFTTDEERLEELAMGVITRVNWGYCLGGQPPYIQDERTKQHQTSRITCRSLCEPPSQKGRL